MRWPQNCCKSTLERLIHLDQYHSLHSSLLHSTSLQGLWLFRTQTLKLLYRTFYIVPFQHQKDTFQRYFFMSLEYWLNGVATDWSGEWEAKRSSKMVVRCEGAIPERWRLWRTPHGTVCWRILTRRVRSTKAEWERQSTEKLYRRDEEDKANHTKRLFGGRWGRDPTEAKWRHRDTETIQNKTGEDHNVWRGGRKGRAEDALQQCSNVNGVRRGDTRDDEAKTCWLGYIWRVSRAKSNNFLLAFWTHMLSTCFVHTLTY